MKIQCVKSELTSPSARAGSFNKMANDCLQICTWVAKSRQVCMFIYVWKHVHTYSYIHMYTGTLWQCISWGRALSSCATKLIIQFSQLLGRSSSASAASQQSSVTFTIARDIIYVVIIFWTFPPLESIPCMTRNHI